MEAMMEYAQRMMPSYHVRINGKKDLDKFFETAEKYALPKFLVFSRESSTSTVTKALSTEFRRRGLFGEVRATKTNKDIVLDYGLEDWLKDKKGEKTALVAVDINYAAGKNGAMRKDGKVSKFSLGRATSFAKKYALKKPYFEDEVAQAKLAETSSGDDAGAPPEAETPSKAEL